MMFRFKITKVFVRAMLVTRIPSISFLHSHLLFPAPFQAARLRQRAQIWIYF